MSVHIKVVYGDPEEVQALRGAHTAYVERTHLTSRHMNGRLVRKTLSFSKELRLLEAASCWEDALYNFTRPVKTLRLEREDPSREARGPQRTPAMAAELTDHLWTGKRAVDDCACSCSYQHPIGRLPGEYLPLIEGRGKEHFLA